MPQQKGHREASLCLTCPEAAMVLDEDGFILFICLKLFECFFSKKNTIDHIFVYSYMVHVCMFVSSSTLDTYIHTYIHTYIYILTSPCKNVSEALEASHES